MDLWVVLRKLRYGSLYVVAPYIKPNHSAVPILIFMSQALNAKLQTKLSGFFPFLSCPSIKKPRRSSSNLASVCNPPCSLESPMKSELPSHVLFSFMMWCSIILKLHPYSPKPYISLITPIMPLNWHLFNTYTLYPKSPGTHIVGP